MLRVGAIALATTGLVPASCGRRKANPARPSAERRSPTADGTAAATSANAPLPAAPTRGRTRSAARATRMRDAGPLPGRTKGCPDGMVRVEGEYCPDVLEECAKWDPDYLAHRDNPNFSARCLQFRQSRCFSPKRKHLAFCMDRYEYPDKVGQMPRVLTSWREAQALCQREGKRLCTEDEFNFACEGPKMLPYVTGYQRDPKACNIDKPYIMPDHKHRMLHYKQCQKDPRCSRELRRLDQRHAVGAVNTCISWAGVVDLNGNVNEWVTRLGVKSPHRGGLKGGWWGPVRDRCRPTVIFHKEFDYGYEAGFRCCRDLAGRADAGTADAAADAAGGAPGLDAGTPDAATAAGGKPGLDTGTPHAATAGGKPSLDAGG